MSEKSERDVGRRWALFVGLPFIVLVAIAAVLFSGTERSPGGQERPSQPASREQSSGGTGLGHPALGSADAPVVMLEFGDFQ